MLATSLRALGNVGFQPLALGPVTSYSLQELIGQAIAVTVDGALVRCSASSGLRYSSAAGTDDQQKKDADAPTSVSTPTSLRSLLQASSQRIAEGRIGELGDAGGNADAAKLAAALEQLIPMSPSAEPPYDGSDSDAQDRAQRLGVMQAEAEEMRAAAAAGPDGGGAGGAAAAQPLYHRRYGYAALGGALPSEDAGGAAGLLGSIASAQPRIHPRRRFMPGAMYEPQDLNPFAARAADAQRRSAELRPGVEEVIQKADYKNVAFLTRWFLSPAGRLLPRRQTRLPVNVHRYVSRQVRLARHMGLIAGEARLDKMHLARLREEELAEATRRAEERDAAAAAGGAVAGGRARPNELLDFGA